jgi:hypothetical protein
MEILLFLLRQTLPPNELLYDFLDPISKVMEGICQHIMSRTIAFIHRKRKSQQNLSPLAFNFVKNEAF